jgi:rare lipoprotein A
VAANLGKKYIIPKDSKKTFPTPIYKIGNKYEVKGKFYFPHKDMLYSKTGIASWYGPKFHGKLTANGEIYNQNQLTAAHKTLPLPSAVKVTNLKNNKSLNLRINDRGPFVNDRIIDLSSKAADLLGLKKQGTGLVKVTILQEQSKELEKLAKKGLFPELKDLPKPDSPNINKPQKSIVKIEGINKTYTNKRNRIKYDLKNLKSNYKIFIKLGTFSTLKSANLMKEKLQYIKGIKIYDVVINNKNMFQVKSGPYIIVDKVDKILSLLTSKGMQGAKIIIE